MIKRSQYRTSPIINSANDLSDQSDSIARDMEKALATHFDRTAVQPRQQSLYDQISSIISGTKSKFSSVDQAVKDMQERSGFSAHIKATNNYFEQKKQAQTQSQSDNQPDIFQVNPSIQNTFDNYIADTRGNVSVPAILERVKNIHKRDVDNDSLWSDDKLVEYISKKCDEAKEGNPNTDDSPQGLGRMTNFNESDMDISNTDALHALSPVKASKDEDDDEEITEIQVRPSMIVVEEEEPEEITEIQVSPPVHKANRSVGLIDILASFDNNDVSLIEYADDGEKAPKDVKASDLDWLDKEDQKQLRDWGTKMEVEGNPPKWAAEPAKWKRAKKIVKKYWKNYKEPYGVVSWLYHSQLGGKIKKKKKH